MNKKIILLFGRRIPLIVLYLKYLQPIKEPRANEDEHPVEPEAEKDVTGSGSKNPVEPEAEKDIPGSGSKNESRRTSTPLPGDHSILGKF